MRQGPAGRLCFVTYSTSSTHGILFLSVAMSTTDRQVSDWLPSSMQPRGRYSVASNPPQLYVAMAGSTYRPLPVMKEAFGNDGHELLQK